MPCQTINFKSRLKHCWHGIYTVLSAVNFYMDELIGKIRHAQIIAGENAVIESLRAKGFKLDDEINPKIIEKDLSKLTVLLSDLEKALPLSTYNRIVKNLMIDNGYSNITKFAKQAGYCKQFISKIINGDVNNTLPFNIEVFKEGRTTWVKRV